ncbi:Uncharacterised protein [Mycobacteroides abscessus subsp. abscessus]|nr:Uncharacterised protein [Mycobacteroides abscessus subsp. abscessus]
MPDDLSEQGMVKGDVEAAAISGNADEAVDLGLFDGLFAGEIRQHIDVERFAQAQVLQSGKDIGLQLFDAAGEKRGELGGDRSASAELPHTVDLPQGARCPCALDEMSQKQGVAAGGFPHTVCGMLLELSAEDGLDEIDALLFGERRQRDSDEVVVFPERGDGVGHGLTAAHGCDDLHGSINCELMEQRRRQLVEEMRVVDADDRIALCQKAFTRR